MENKLKEFRKEFTPKFFRLFPYSKDRIKQDIFAGIIVGIIALPLAIAFAIASGVSPDRGLVTAVVAGFLISFLGGSRVQIGGPTGAFIVIVYGIVSQHGVDALIVATFMAGIMLVLMGFARLGSIIKFIPYPLIVGFTSGIALIIFSSQINDFLGLGIEKVPADFVSKWQMFFSNIENVNFYALGLGLFAILFQVFWNKYTKKIPAPLIVIIISTLLVYIFKIPVATIGSSFGELNAVFPKPIIPNIDWVTFQSLVNSAFAIALLGGIESLLSAVVADGMIGKNHNSNMELVGQGVANIGSAIFGGIPATGAMARTAANVKNGGRTPIAGITHAFVVLMVILFLGKTVSYIPMATLAGILIIVAYNMSEWRNFVSIARGQRSDMLILVMTFVLTVVVDLVMAIEVGMILAIFLFLRDSIKNTDVQNLNIVDIEDEVDDPLALTKFEVPKGVLVYEINGPMFFGAAYKFRDAIRQIERPPKVLIIRMRNVHLIDGSGTRVLKEVTKYIQRNDGRVILSGVTDSKILEELNKSRLLFMVGKQNVKPAFPEALARAEQILEVEENKQSKK